MIDALHAAGSFCAPWAAAILRASLQGGLTLALAWLICRTIPRLPAALKCWLLRLAFLKLLIALIWSAPLDLAVLHPDVGLSPPVAVASDPIHDLPAPAPAYGAPPAQSHFDPQPILLAIWAAGMLSALTVLLRNALATTRFRRGCRDLNDSHALAIYLSIAEKLGISRRPALLTCDRCGTPMLLGCLRPAVVVPQQILLSCDARQLRLMLAHELAHHQRHDLWWAWLPAICRLIFWFHPLVWLAGREWNVHQETACDQLAISITGATSCEYGGALLAAATRFTANRRLLAVGTCLSRKHLERRIKAMRYAALWSPRRRVLAGCALSCIAVIALVPWRLVAQEPPSSTIPATGRAARQDGIPSSSPARADADEGRTRIGLGVVFTDSAPLRASRSGMIRSIRGKEGDTVKSGDVLVEFEMQRELADVAVAEAELERASLDLHRKRALRSQNAISPDEMAEAAAAEAISKAGVQKAQAELNAGFIRSPIDGVIVNHGVHAGMFVQQGEPLLTVVSVNAPKVRFDVPVRIWSRFKVGDPVRFRSDFTGRIYFLSPQIDPQSGTGEIKATLDDPQHKLRSGMTGDVSTN